MGAAVLLCGPAAEAVGAQSLTRGRLSGTVQVPGGELPGTVLLEARRLPDGPGRAAEVSRTGSFELERLTPGTYEVLAEAPGYRPRVVRDVAVRPGEEVRIAVSLEPAEPPVTRRDTVTARQDVAVGVAGDAPLRLGREMLADLPAPTRTVSDLARLASTYDMRLGVEGLPGSFTDLVVDGLPYTPARHPRIAAPDPAGIPAPRIGMERLVPAAGGTDVEWSGSAGGYLRTGSRAAGVDRRFEAEGSGSGDVLRWSDQRPDGLPSTLSVRGSGAAAFPLAREGSFLFVGVEGVRDETGRPAAGAPAPGGLDVGGPWVQRDRQLSGIARLDWNLAPRIDVTARAAFTDFRSGGGATSRGTFEYGSDVPVDGTDVTAGAEATAELSDRFDLELQAGVNRSTRTWAPGPGTAPSVLGTRMVADGRHLGVDADLPAEVTRTTARGGATLHFQTGAHRAKAGLLASSPFFSYRYVDAAAGSYLVGAPPGEESEARGSFVQATRTPTNRFTVPEYGAFAQYAFDVAPGLRLLLGGRYEEELLPRDDVERNAAWAERTGLANDRFEDRLRKVATRLGLRWDLTGDGTTLLRGSVGVHYDQLDPAALNDVMALDGDVEVRRRTGTLPDWPEPDAGDAATRPRLALLGPDLQAPRTARARVELTRALGAGTTLRLSGTLRRTKFLLRWRDLNRVSRSAGTDQFGRPLYGSLARHGALLAAEPGSNRRFGEFDRVWALNADGWSRYGGVTASVERTGRWVDVRAGYTYSTTTDNWLGAGNGRPEAALPPGLDEEEWTEATSDFDVPHRLSGAVRVSFRDPVPVPGSLTALYRYRSGRPFTPGVRAGVDANGDGSGLNDPAYVPDTEALRSLAGRWSCLDEQIGDFAERNSCRGDGLHMLDLRLAVEVFELGDAGAAELVLEGLNLLDRERERWDEALLLVDESGELEPGAEGAATTVPYRINPDFGATVGATGPGRMLRVGFRIGGTIR